MDLATVPVAKLRAAGLPAIGTDAEVLETWTPTPEGAQVARQLAMGDAAAFNAILDAVDARAWTSETLGRHLKKTSSQP